MSLRIYFAVLTLLACSRSLHAFVFAPVRQQQLSSTAASSSTFNNLQNTLQGSTSKLSTSSKLYSTSTSTIPVDWSFLDAVYLITASPDGKPAKRVETVKLELEKAGLWDRTLVKAFKTDDVDRVRGCYASHMAVLKEIQSKFKRQKEYRVLILEDNLETTAGLTPQVVSGVARFLRQQEDTRWDVFHLVMDNPLTLT